MTQHDDELDNRFKALESYLIESGYVSRAEKTKELVAENAVLRNALEKISAPHPNPGRLSDIEMLSLFCDYADEALGASNGEALSAIREAMELLELEAISDPYAPYEKTDAGRALVKLKKHFGDGK